MQSYDFRAGEVLLINKPLTWTSFQVVNKLKFVIKAYEKKLDQNSIPLQTHKLAPKDKNGKQVAPTKISKLKIGHAGTLDPLATGLLIVCTGKETKNIELYQSQEKEYTGTFFIGATTPCYDLEKEIDFYFPTEHITNELIFETVKQFTGIIQQTPPLFSAININGRRAYKIARAGGTAEIPSKEIEIKEFEITRIALPEIDFRIVCSKGTYIRSLARDFGLALNSGAHLTALCRTKIGEYTLANTIDMTAFENKLNT